jgi:hypothetical protein
LKVINNKKDFDSLCVRQNDIQSTPRRKKMGRAKRSAALKHSRRQVAFPRKQFSRARLNLTDCVEWEEFSNDFRFSFATQSR